VVPEEQLSCLSLLPASMGTGLLAMLSVDQGCSCLRILALQLHQPGPSS
jgi:hypothetical protein